MQRFLVDRHCIDGEIVVLQGEVVHQIRDVLRLRKGARVVIFNDEGLEYTVVLESVKKDRIAGTIESTRKHFEPAIKITLYQALLKSDRFEFVLQKCTEIGVTEFVPIMCERCVAGKPGANKIQRWEKVIKEATEQSGRSTPPALNPAVPFEDAILSARGLSIIASTGSASLSLREIIRPTSNINIFIGPEGGFTDGELESALRHGAKEVALGPNTLRSETAGLVAATVVLYECGQLDRTQRDIR
ncbi:MAG: RsmE family RNA methyltransferase [Dehalococcoidia bacterium]|jgi:16S rRNA (uracil1498-N3)-methyltransferase